VIGLTRHFRRVALLGVKGFFSECMVVFFRLNVVQQHTSTSEDEISNRLAALQVRLYVLTLDGIFF